MNDLTDAAARFVRAYHSDRGLVEEQRGWSRTIQLVASDSGEAVVLRVLDGRVNEVFRGDGAADVVICAESVTLCDILDLRQSPNEPYLFGELTVRGDEADFLRLDYITSRMCPT